MSLNRLTGIINKHNSPRVLQGDILRDVTYYQSVHYSGREVILNYIDFPFVYILSQDCDLTQENDHNMKAKVDDKGRLTLNQNREPIYEVDKTLISVMLAPIYNFEIFRKGEHLQDLYCLSDNDKKTYTAQIIGSAQKKPLVGNNNPRFHYLQFKQSCPIPPSVIDFKHYFTMSLDEIKQLRSTQYICTVAALFKNDISQRFASYLSRVGIPVIVES